jgi:hypothetical protein
VLALFVFSGLSSHEAFERFPEDVDLVQDNQPILTLRKIKLGASQFFPA